MAKRLSADTTSSKSPVALRLLQSVQAYEVDFKNSRVTYAIAALSRPGDMLLAMSSV